MKGRLDLDAGAGRHRLWISDEAATAGDIATIADRRSVVDPGRIDPEIVISGLAPAPIGYRANLQTATSPGNFAGGVTVWTGRGADTITIDGTHERVGPNPDGSPLRTVTTLNTGAGADTSTSRSI